MTAAPQAPTNRYTAADWLAGRHESFARSSTGSHPGGVTNDDWINVLADLLREQAAANAAWQTDEHLRAEGSWSRRIHRVAHGQEQLARSLDEDPARAVDECSVADGELGRCGRRCETERTRHAQRDGR